MHGTHVTLLEATYLQLNARVLFTGRSTVLEPESNPVDNSDYEFDLQCPTFQCGGCEMGEDLLRCLRGPFIEFLLLWIRQPRIRGDIQAEQPKPLRFWLILEAHEVG